MENKIEKKNQPAPVDEYSQGFINRVMNDELPEGGYLIFDKNGKLINPKKPKQLKKGD